MPPEASEISKWIPVIGTLLGAILGFLGFFSIAVYNQNKAEKIAKKNRRREKLEELFIASNKYFDYLLLHFGRYHQVMTGKLTLKDVSDLEIKNGKETGYDYHRIRMLIYMYFPEIKPEFKKIKALQDELNDYKEQCKKADFDGLTYLNDFNNVLGDFVKRADDFDKNIVNLNIEASKSSK